jgi:capsular exopolysaccharide synthesis family protein
VENKSSNIPPIDPVSYQNETIADIDFDKLRSIIRKSMPWLIAMLLITNLGAYLLIRWTKPVFESESELKLEFKSEATALGINNLVENQNLNHLSGEIELLSSKLFFNKVIDATDIDVSYNYRGNILDDERYNHSAFTVDYKMVGGMLYDQEINIHFIGGDQFGLTYEIAGEKYSKTHKFGEKIKTGQAELTITPTSYYNNEVGNGHFFVIHSRKALEEYFAANFNVQPRNFQANTIRLSLKDNNRFKAKELVDVIDSLYLQYSQDQKTVENNQKINWLNTELGQIGEKLEGYEDYFEKFTLKNRTNNLDVVMAETIKAINDLDSQRFQLTKRINALHELGGQVNNETYGLIAINEEQYAVDLIADIHRYNDIILKNKRVLDTYSESTQAYQNKLQELNQAKDFLKSSIEAKMEYLQDNMSSLNRRKTSFEASFNDIPGKDREYKKAKLYYALYEDHYLALMQAKTDFQVARAGTKTDITILSEATLPVRPIAPDKLIIHGIGLVMGLVLCFVFIAIRYLLSNTITNLAELERLTGSPILGAIPRYSKSKLVNTRMVIDENPRSSISEALRSIRTNIEFLSSSKTSKVISVTSTVGSEGKTFVSVNLGGVISLSKKKVVIVDLDMRKPRVHRAFNNEVNDKGVSTILIDKHSIEESICSTTIDSLKYIPAGPTPPNPSELLLNGSFEKLLEDLKSQFDIVILDTPPSAIVTDATLVMKKVDVPIYVFKADYSKKSFVETLNRLIQVNKFGHISIILNSLQSSGDKKYGYGYYLDDNE